MAVWQVVFHVVPRAAVVDVPLLTPAALEQTDWWKGRAFPADFAARLTAVASMPGVATGPMATWGRVDGNRIDIESVDGRVRRMVASVDVRRLDSRFGAGLIEFVRKVDGVLVRADGRVIDSTIGAFANAIRSSSAWQYANDTASFLAARAKEERDDDA